MNRSAYRLESYISGPTTPPITPPPGVTRKLDIQSGRRVAPDYPLFVLMLVILSVGLFMVFDTSYARASQSTLHHGNPWYYFRQQLFAAIFGLMALMAAMKARYWKLSRYGIHLVGLASFLLVLVLIPHIGVRGHGAARWLKLGPLQLQPSEIAKICSVIYLSSYIARRRTSIRQLQQGLLGALAPVLVMAALIIKEPDLGTAMTLVVTTITMLAVGGACAKHLIALATVGILLVGILAMSKNYSRERLTSFIAGKEADQTYAFQVRQSVLAFEAGGIQGRGIGRGEAKFFHLPAPYTDFIGATLGEEFGLIGSITLLTLFFCFTLCGYNIAHRCPNSFGCLLATGLCTMITFQALLNLAVITRTVPNTGVPLPMISFGGSSLVLILFSIGIILSISRWPDLRMADAWTPARYDTQR